MVKYIAEIGINHQGDVELAKRLITGAKFSGCDCVKFQKRNPEVCVPRDQWDMERETPFGRLKYIDYKRRMEFGNDEYNNISDHADKLEIPWFASVWDIDSAEFMAQRTNMCKVPSAKMKDIELLRKVNDLFEFVVISTGMCDEQDVETAVSIVHPNVIMHSVGSYPTEYNNLNLGYIKHLKHKYGEIADIGYSGHECGFSAAFVAVAFGATWIERHITIDRDMIGSDHKSSIDGGELFYMIQNIKKLEKALNGEGPRDILDCEASKITTLRGT